MARAKYVLTLLGCNGECGYAVDDIPTDACCLHNDVCVLANDYQEARRMMRQVQKAGFQVKMDPVHPARTLSGLLENLQAQQSG